MSNATKCRLQLKRSLAKARGSIVILCAAGLYAQNPVFLGTPYPKVVIAPGQVTTLSVVGSSVVLPEDSYGYAVVQTSQVPLPTTLAGFTVSIGQEPTGYSASLPIFSVNQENICLPLQQTPACVQTLLVVQIPIDLEISPYPVGPGEATSIGFANESIAVSLDPVKVHILTSCDAVLTGLAPNQKPTQLSPCNPLITHADGTLVGPFSRGSVQPAQPGETLILYALGLGATQPAVSAGTASPTPPAVALHHFSLIFDYDCGTIVTGTPTFVGLTPGQVGLYQVNFTVPQPVACAALPLGSDPTSGGNLTLLSDDWVSSDSVLLYIGANSPAPQ
jgi:uncharacterized protein (TIGR03437 family)